jgi:hypothetical protein
MGSEIEIQSKLQPASFVDRKKSLSDGQEHLMKLLVERISNKQPITQEDIVECYFKVASKDGETIRVRGCFGSPYFYCNQLEKDSSLARSRANMWFKQNLGACIIKGKLLVIPVIELPNSETKAV